MKHGDEVIIDPAELEAIIRQATVCRLGLCQGHVPYVVPVHFGYADQCLYFHSSPAGRKLEMIKANPLVCFEIETDVEMLPQEIACRWNTRYRCLIGYGRASFVKEPLEKMHGLDAIMRQCSGSEKRWAYEYGILDKLVVIKVAIESMTGKKSKL